ncbi:FkbM family methyltransferase [Nisaea denitrificans]|uniref:FkbM family methyltransferase n=1 Tax=Nisaea denitrificans TaxID=390877 RepID=UPI00040C99A0|nr:FkbM family methyltransferase [Nisaea denitrificans]
MTSSTSDYTPITHPIEMPDCPYLIYGTDALTHGLINLIKLIRPGALFSGVVEEGTVPAPTGDNVVLISEPDWLRRAVELGAAGWTADRILVFPFATDCPSNGLAVFMTRYAQMVGLDPAADRTDVIQLSSNVATDMLLRDGHAKAEDGKISIAPRLFPSLNDPNRIKAHVGQINAVGSALADECSKNAYRSVLLGTPANRAECFVNTMLRGQQYFEYARVFPGDTVLNFGVFDGFELPVFAALMKGRGRLINIDPLGYRFLSRSVRTAMEQFEGVAEIWPYCVTNEDGVADFLAYDDGQAASHEYSMTQEAKERSPDKLQTFPTRKITSLVEEMAPDRIDLMKFDVEGAEEMILKDIAPIISRYRPKLAFSVYHATRHLWEMPLALMEMCEGYDFYFGSYSMTRYESIFYCLPRD